MDEKIAEISNLRWDPYVFFKNEECNIFFKKHFAENGINKKILFVLGLGFDPRMNFGIMELSKDIAPIEIEIVLLKFKQEKNKHSKKYKNLTDANLVELKSIKNVVLKEIQLNDVGKKREIEAANFFTKQLISDFTDVFLDISSLPRSIYFSTAGKILSLIDIVQVDSVINFFITTTENAEIDSMIKEVGINNDLEYQHGFGGQIEVVSKSIPKIWFPLTGEGKTNQFRSANQFIEPAEICPMLPFPSKDLRRSDNIYIENHDLFFNELQIESQNIMYVPEQNPFEAYKKIIKAADNYNKTLIELGGCKAVISSFSSKLLSIGALLAAYEYKNKKKKLSIGILNVNSMDYKIEDEKALKKSVKKSELFVNWLTGTPYQN
ncbi:hypothetical protein [Maribacter sp. 2308TA10-17]|uniref:hypothetical protein n=1 Tax=Maribacter sp. 2308TA10-17 TaxID=3386276 RepID=UPI0039BD74BB